MRQSFNRCYISTSTVYPDYACVDCYYIIAIVVCKHCSTYQWVVLPVAIKGRVTWREQLLLRGPTEAANKQSSKVPS